MDIGTALEVKEHCEVSTIHHWSVSNETKHRLCKKKNQINFKKSTILYTCTCRYMYNIIMYYRRKRYLPSSSVICTTIMSVGSITLSPSLVTVTPNISTQFSAMMSSTMVIGAQITLGPPAVNVSSGIAKKSSVTVRERKREIKINDNYHTMKIACNTYLWQSHSLH